MLLLFTEHEEKKKFRNENNKFLEMKKDFFWKTF
jgi:hypothetical protein